MAFHSCFGYNTRHGSNPRVRTTWLPDSSGRLAFILDGKTNLPFGSSLHSYSPDRKFIHSGYTSSNFEVNKSTESLKKVNHNFPLFPTLWINYGYPLHLSTLSTISPTILDPEL